jgi:hypothetical protein
MPVSRSAVARGDRQQQISTLFSSSSGLSELELPRSEATDPAPDTPPNKKTLPLGPGGFSK